MFLEAFWNCFTLLKGQKLETARRMPQKSFFLQKWVAYIQDQIILKGKVILTTFWHFGTPYYVRLSRNLHVHYVRLSRNLYILCTFKQKLVHTLCTFKQKFAHTLCTFKAYLENIQNSEYFLEVLSITNAKGNLINVKKLHIMRIKLELHLSC